MIEDNYRQQGLRKLLIKQLKEKGIKDNAVLHAMESVPRHVFFDAAFLEHAYQDKAFPIGEGQTISQPYTVAFQSELLEIKKGDKVLEIGTGSGYQSCVLNQMGAVIYSIEYNKNLFKKTSQFFLSSPYKNVKCFQGDGSQGLPTFAPYDKIIVTAGAPNVPDKLIEQLNPGGILVIPVGDEKTQYMLRIRKNKDGSTIEEKHGGFKFVPLLGKDGWNK